MISERDFAQLDQLLREKPNATTIALEGMILYANNQTRAWLDGKDEKDRAEILKIATKLTPEHRELFRQRREGIRHHVQETLKKKEREITRKKQRLVQQKEKLVNGISNDGLWQSEGDVYEGLAGYSSETRKAVALKQLNFRKVVSQQVSDKALFSFSKEEKQHSVEQLRNNLVKIIGEAHPVIQKEPPPKKQKSNDPYVKNPGLLVGKRVRHYFVNDDGQRQNYLGTVVGLVPGTCAWFNVSYDDEDGICSFDLLDYCDGDLEVLGNKLNS